MTHFDLKMIRCMPKVTDGLKSLLSSPHTFSNAFSVDEYHRIHFVQ